MKWNEIKHEAYALKCKEEKLLKAMKKYNEIC